SAALPESGSDAYDAGQSGDQGWPSPKICRPVSQLTVGVVPPGPNGPVVLQRQGMNISSRDGGDAGREIRDRRLTIRCNQDRTAVRAGEDRRGRRVGRCSYFVSTHIDHLGYATGSGRTRIGATNIPESCAAVPIERSLLRCVAI